MASGRHQRKKRSAKPQIIICVLLVFAAVSALFFSLDKKETFASGMKIENIDISKMTVQKAKAKLQKEESALLEKYRVEVEYEDKKFEITYQDIGVKTDLEEILDKAIKLSSGSEFRLTVSYDEAKLQSEVAKIAQSISKKAVEPKIESFDFETKKFVVSKGENGYSADESKLYEDVKSLLDSQKSGKVYAEVNEQLCLVQNDELESSFGKIAYFKTECTNNENSEHNMRLAMELMDKAVVAAGGIISFNDTVGDSTTPEGGWVKSGAWVNGELTEEYGGGLCQAATTLYNCALLANMDVEERFCHLQPSTYCDIGLDATIDYGNIDLIMRNTSEYPIYIVSEMNGKILEMTMYGYIPKDYSYIEIYGEQTGTIAMPEPEYKVDEEMPSRSYKLVRKGYEGKTAKAVRTWFDEYGGVIKTESLPSSNYSEVAPLYKIASDIDVSKIPEGSKEGVIEEEPIIDVPSGGGVTNHEPDDVPLG